MYHYQVIRLLGFTWIYIQVVTREEGERFVDEDGNLCVVEKDPETGKLTTRVIGQNKKSKQKKGGTDTNGMTLEEIQMFKEGHRQQDSDSDYSYRSIVSPGGTRRVRRRRKRGDGTYSNSDSYNSDDDEDGKARRRIRRRNRRHGSGSAHSYYSVESEGGTRHVRRRRKREDGTYSDSESHHSPDEDIATFFKEKSKIVNKKSKPGNVFEPDAGYESDCSVKSVVSVGGTRRVVKKKRIRDKSGNVVGYGDPEPLKPGEQEYLQKRQNQTLNTNEPDFVPDENYDSDYSVKSVISDGGTRHHVKQKRIRDESGNVVGYGEKQSLKDGEKAFLLKRKGIDAALAYRNGRRLKEMQKTDDGVGENVKRNSTNENQTSSKMLSVKPRKNRKGYEKDTTQIDLRDLNKDLNMPNYSKRLDTTPLDFSDASSEDDVDLSKMTEEEREQYLSDKMKRQTEREKRRREKYGSRYDEIMKNRERKRLEREEREKIERLNQMREESRTRLRLPSSNRTLSSLGNLAPSRSSSSLNKSKEKPKSMVTYEKGTPRRLSWPNQDVKEHSRSHLRENRRSREDSSTRLKGDASKQYTGKMPPLPPIPQGRILERLGTTDVKDLNQLRKKRGRTNLSSLTSEDYTFVSNTEVEEDDRNLDDIREDTVQQEKISPFDVDTSGKVTLKKGKKKIDLNDVTPEMLKQLGIDPNLSKKEIASLLKKKFGQNLIMTDGGTFIGTKGIGEYRKDVTDIELIEDPHLDTSTLKGVRRVNVLFKRGGEQLAEHLQRIVQEANSNLFRKLDYAKDLDEKDASIDFLNHYRLVDPRRIENYAKAFVVEDGDLDSVINNLDTKIALSGVQQLQEMTDKQVKYVLKVLHIDDASQVTFRMFAVISALCERITSMDSLSKYLLEMCNLGDLERKMDLYKAMFYHNIESDRDPNHITAESLKIELIAGGLNWKQRKYILRQMVPNKFGDISFLDYITYIPLFLSIHDNICENPLDSSTQKYCMPPRKRPPSSQRDLNPLGCPLSKRSSYLMNKQAKDLIEGRLKSAHFRKEHLEMVRQFQKLSDNALSNKLNGIFHPTVREDTQMSLHDKIDLIY